jgi:hypothetical protein
MAITAKAVAPPIAITAVAERIVAAVIAPPIAITAVAKTTIAPPEAAVAGPAETTAATVATAGRPRRCHGQEGDSDCKGSHPGD